MPALALIALAGVAVCVLGPLTGRAATLDDPSIPVLVAMAAGFVPFGVFVMRRVPRHRLGRLMVLGGTSAFVAAASILWSATGPGAWLSQWTWWPPYAVIPVLLLLAPDGRLPSRRWQPLAVVLVGAAAAVTAAFAAAGAVQPDGVLVDPDVPLTPAAAVLVQVAFGALAVNLAAALAVLLALVLRWRRAERLERGQLACLLPVLVLVLAGIGLQAQNVPFGWVPAATALPLALTVAVLRYQLHDLDLYVHRGTVWLVLTALAVAVYAGVVAVIGATLTSPGSPVASVLGAAAVAALLQPGQRLAQRAVSRLLYGRRDEPYAVVTQLSRHLGTMRDPLAVLPEIAATIVDGLRVPYAAVRVAAEDGGAATVAERGRWAGPPVAFPMTAHGRDVGELLVAPRRPGTSFSAAETALLSDLAGQAALAAEACRSALALQRARDRLVLAREEERRRLRRDLHDGVAAALVGTRMLAEVARRSAPAGGAVPQLLDTLAADLDTCTAEVRELIDGLRPAALDDGLEGALRGLVERFGGPPMPEVALDVDGDLGALPAAVEVATYRVATEALTNVVKHAHARHVGVVVRRDERHLELTVSDDGDGIPAPVAPGHEGVGLSSIRGRVDELGGRCEITSGPAGTSVAVLLPLGA